MSSCSMGDPHVFRVPLWNGSGINLQLCDLLVRDLLVGLQARNLGGKLCERDDIVSLDMLQVNFLFRPIICRSPAEILRR